MFKRKNKFSIFVLLIAAIGFAFFSVGGDFLHQEAHHHPDQFSFDQCLWSILQVQALILCLWLVLLFRSNLVSQIETFYQFSISKSYYHLANLRAPPAR